MRRHAGGPGHIFLFPSPDSTDRHGILVFIDTLKVDRSFIRDLASDTEDQEITKAIISMGRTLSLSVVAEGVETRQQHGFLRSHACDEMRGCYFSKPVAPDRFAELLGQHVTAPVKR